MQEDSIWILGQMDRIGGMEYNREMKKGMEKVNTVIVIVNQKKLTIQYHSFGVTSQTVQ